MPRFGDGVTKLQIPETVMATTGSWIWNLVPPSPKREKPGRGADRVAQAFQLWVQATSRRKMEIGTPGIARHQLPENTQVRLSLYHHFMESLL